MTASDTLDGISLREAVLCLEGFSGGTLALAAAGLYRATPDGGWAGPLDGRLTLRGFRVVSFDPGQAIFTGDEAARRLLGELQSDMAVYDLASAGEGRYRLEGSGREPWFEAVIACDAVRVEWHSNRQRHKYEGGYHDETGCLHLVVPFASASRLRPGVRRTLYSSGGDAVLRTPPGADECHAAYDTHQP